MDQIKKKRVLLIDDNRHFIRFLKGHLLARGYEIVEEADDYEQAIKLFWSEKPDLTLIDFELLSINGIEILQKIMAQNPEAMVIMLSGKGDVATMQLCLDNGAYHFIRKDYPMETIFSVIEESLKMNTRIES